MNTQVKIGDKYELEHGRAILSGTQALVRLLLMQRLRDERRGLNTRGYVSGYRGSPLGSVDQEMWRAKKYLDPKGIYFQAGVNEELAATAVWGTQQVNLFEDATCDGVFGMWYGKGPGVDRSCDVLRHANHAGSSAKGGVLVVAGDDHACKSSTLPHQTDLIFKALGMPLLYPASVQEFLDYGLHGWEMSRYSGCWVGFKGVTDVVDSTASVDISLDRVQVVTPTDFEMPEGGLSIRHPDLPTAQEVRLYGYKIPAAQAYARANRLDRIVIDDPTAKVGIITAGKSWLDTRQALSRLGLGDNGGIRVCKIAMVWPLEPQILAKFVRGLDEIIVVEEKRSLLEEQVKDYLYHLPDDQRPRVSGKLDVPAFEARPNRWLLRPDAVQAPHEVAAVIARSLGLELPKAMQHEQAALIAQHGGAPEQIQRPPHFCSGCPHNTSTRVPEGSRATAGIGCHGMATFIYPQTQMFCQMGGEGVQWVGQQPFVKTRHVFANLGDGTYFHSGTLAIRAAIAAKVPITYKILFNGVVAMTGGQPHDGTLSVAGISQQLAAEGVGEIVIVTDNLERYKGVNLPHKIDVVHRDDLDGVQKRLRGYEGVSAIIYDQACAAERRRKRKRGTVEDPDRWVVINEELCEACGDCTRQSNCISVINKETALGVKRAIDQDACNKDYSCLNGFCPSIVTVEGGRRRKGRASEQGDRILPVPIPELPAVGRSYSIMVTGIGGTGVVTVGAILGMAAHIENRAVSILDMAGLAQKGGAVWSHLRIAEKDEDIATVRLDEGELDALIGCDLVVSASPETLSRCKPGVTRAVINNQGFQTGIEVRSIAEQARTGDASAKVGMLYPKHTLQDLVNASLGEQNVFLLNASELAVKWLGQSMAANIFLIGVAWQRGLIPLALESIQEAIRLNGVAMEANLKGFDLGRRAAAGMLEDGMSLSAASSNGLQHVDSQTDEQSLKTFVEGRAKRLAAYQNEIYAERYRRQIAKITEAESRLRGMPGKLTQSAALNLYKLMAYKDEYEVARLLTSEAFAKQVSEQFEGNYRLVYHLAPTWLTGKSAPASHKRKFGTWLVPGLKMLARMKGLRGTAFDLFGVQKERKTERELIRRYEATLDEVSKDLTRDNFDIAVELANIGQEIKGYGHIKERYLHTANRHWAELLKKFRMERMSRISDTQEDTRGAPALKPGLTTISGTPSAP